MEKIVATHPKQDFTPPDTPSDIKPVLIGQTPPGDPPHSILYYVDRNDPKGPFPQNPNQDPMYFYWEQAIAYWLGPITPPPGILPNEDGIP